MAVADCEEVEAVLFEVGGTEDRRILIGFGDLLNGLSSLRLHRINQLILLLDWLLRLWLLLKILAIIVRSRRMLLVLDAHRFLVVLLGEIVVIRYLLLLPILASIVVFVHVQTLGPCVVDIIAS